MKLLVLDGNSLVNRAFFGIKVLIDIVFYKFLEFFTLKNLHMVKEPYHKPSRSLAPVDVG